MYLNNEVDATSKTKIKTVVLTALSIIYILYVLYILITSFSNLLNSIMYPSDHFGMQLADFLKLLMLFCFSLNILFPFPQNHRKASFWIVLIHVILLFIYILIVWFNYIVYPRTIVFSPAVPVFYSVFESILSIIFYPTFVLLIGLLAGKNTEKLAAFCYIIFQLEVLIKYIIFAPESIGLKTFRYFPFYLALCVILFIHPVLSEPILTRKETSISEE